MSRPNNNKPNNNSNFKETAKRVAKDAAKSAAKAAAKTVLKAIISSNDQSWYVKYGPVTPAANKQRPMDPVFNLAITNIPAMGTVPKYIDLNISWGNFFETRSFELITQKAMQQLRQNLRSNLPYGLAELRRYLANSVSIAILAKQFERDVHWNLYSSEAFRNFSDAWKYSMDTANLRDNGVFNLYFHDYLSDTQWPITSTLYEQIAFQAGTNIKLPPALYDFINHYFNNVFVTRSDATNAQIIRLRINELPLVDENGSVTMIDVTTTTVKDLFYMIKRHVDNSALIIADLERSATLKQLEMGDYKSSNFNLIYDETFLQAVENGYTSSSAVSANGFVRLDEKFSSSDPLTQYLFMGGVQSFNTGSDEAYFPAFTINSMTVKCYTIPELRWPLGLLSEASMYTLHGITYVPTDGYFTSQEEMFFGINVTTDINASFKSNISISFDTISRQYGSASGILPYNSTLSNVEIVAPLGASAYSYDVDNTALFNRMESAPTRFYGWLATEFVTTSEVKLYIARKLRIDNPSFGKYTVTAFGDTDIVAGTRGLNGIANSSAILWLGEDDNYSTAYVLNQINLMQNIDTQRMWKLNSVSVDADVYILSSNIAMNRDRDGIEFRAINCMRNFNGTIPNLEINNSETTEVVWNSMDNDQVWQRAPIYSADLSSPTGIRYVVIYASPVTANVGYGFDTSFSELGLASYIADNVDVHIPFLSAGNFSTVVAVNPGEDGAGSQYEAHVVNSSPTLIKETAKPYFYNVLDLEPVLYRMFTSLFSMEYKRFEGRTSK